MIVFRQEEEEEEEEEEKVGRVVGVGVGVNQLRRADVTRVNGQLRYI